jgi:hypothetical protein
MTRKRREIKNMEQPIRHGRIEICSSPMGRRRQPRSALLPVSQNRHLKDAAM